jgi:hypothetical protein
MAKVLRATDWAHLSSGNDADGEQSVGSSGLSFPLTPSLSLGERDGARGERRHPSARACNKVRCATDRSLPHSVVLWSLPSRAVALNWVENERLIMDWKHTLILLITAGFLTSGCKEKTATEKLADKASQTAGKTSDAIKNGVKKAGDSVEKAYEKTREAVKDGAKATSDAVKHGVEKTGEVIDQAGEKVKELGK